MRKSSNNKQLGHKMIPYSHTKCLICYTRCCENCGHYQSQKKIVQCQNISPQGYCKICKCSVENHALIYIYSTLPFNPNKSISEVKKNILNSKVIKQNDKIVIKYGSLPQQMTNQIITKDIDTALNNFDQITKKDQKVMALICQDLLSVPPTKNQIAKSIKIQEKIQIKAQKQNDQASIVMLALKSYAQQGNKQNRLTFTDKSNIKTQLTMKILCSQFLANQIKFTQKLPQKQYTYDQLINNTNKLQKFKTEYIQNLSKQFNVPKNAIIIHRIQKGSIQVHFSVDKTYSQKFIKNNKRFSPHPYFQHFQLSPQDFCQKGNFTFPNKDTNGQIQWRGGWPYFQPVKCQRYGLNVSRKYDGANDRWLQMAGRKGEWVVAFHGVKSPGDISNLAGSQKVVINSIFQGLNKGQMLMKGNLQAYRSNNSQNNNGKVGNGIYCTPHIQLTFPYAGTGITINGTKYYLVFQCRVKPQAIKVCQGQQKYWVINQSKDIRPYGVILLQQQQKNNYPNIINLYNDKDFTWDKYKDRILKNTNSLY